MAKALVLFYPLAGRLDVDKDGRIEINCNNEGALFVVARSELTMDDLKDMEPSPELTRLFVPSTEPSSIILAVQVSFTLSQEFYRIQSNILTFLFPYLFLNSRTHVKSWDAFPGDIPEVRWDITWDGAPPRCR